MRPSLGNVVIFTFGPAESKRILTGYPYQSGDEAAAIVTRVYGDAVNLKVVLDGPDMLWVTSVPQGTGLRSWHLR